MRGFNPGMESQSRARILVVDDEDNVSYLVASALRLAGHETLTAATGEQAVDAAERLVEPVEALGQFRVFQ